MKKTTSARRASKTERADLYQQVTDKIVAALENGTPPWRKPWRAAEKPAGSAFPVNAVTGKAYSGINVPLLWMAAEERGFSSDRWLTYRQAQLAGGHVRSGESCSLAVIFKPFDVQAEDDQGVKLTDAEGNPVMETRTLLRPLQLFNTQQCEGLPSEFSEGTSSVLTEEETETVSVPVMNRVMGIFNASGVAVNFLNQNRAYYRQVADQIVMPTSGQFFTEADYWSTLLHELVHASGHQKRLNREGITSSMRTFGDPVYAFEELIAEMGSAFLCAEIGIYGEVPHESYVSGWLKVLKEDKRALFRACRQAREASEFLLNLTSDTNVVLTASEVA
ncbi:zincin-like metallopeptidase domain-containing protein [Erwinia rhapontici]|uniref:ArdC family protein n=1 Tax=Erwinia rhapontici TaxID=55212 RepID=UPI003D365751